MPEEWEKQPAKNAQKDKDARWTKKNDESFYGYKNHLGVDKAHKLIRKWGATDAAVHDSQKLDDVLDLSNTGKEVWADSAYRSLQTPDRGGPEGEGLTEPYPPARRTQSSADRAPEVGEHDALEGARPCRARIRPPAERDGRQNRTHHRHRAGEVQNWDDEPRLQHPPVGSARADGGCARLSALTNGVRVASCTRTARSPASVKTVPDRGLTLARALQLLAQLRQKSPKAGIVRGPLIFVSQSHRWIDALTKANCQFTEC